MIIDTNVLIWLERETRRGESGRATAFFESLTETRLCITPTIAGEIASGVSMNGRETWEKFLLPFELLSIGADAAWHYGCQFRALASGSQLIGGNDLWIAATALAHQLPVATGNTDEFRRVEGLSVVGV